jgi:hypothetical protein
MLVRGVEQSRGVQAVYQFSEPLETSHNLQRIPAFSVGYRRFFPSSQWLRQRGRRSWRQKDFQLVSLDGAAYFAVEERRDVVVEHVLMFIAPR